MANDKYKRAVHYAAQQIIKQRRRERKLIVIIAILIAANLLTLIALIATSCLVVRQQEADQLQRADHAVVMSLQIPTKSMHRKERQLHGYPP